MMIFATSNLKPGVAVADYEAWARAVALPTVNALPSMASFRVFRAAGVLAEAIGRQLSEEGASVVISDIRASCDAATPDGMIGCTDEMVAIAAAMPSPAPTFACDVRDPAQVSVEDWRAARIPMGRPGLPQDTASPVAFLCLDEAVYITGESMNVSGGEEPH